MHKVVQSTTIFNRERKTRNQACNRKLSVKSSLYNCIEDVINIEINLFSRKQTDKHNETFIHVYNTFISSEDKIEVDCISSMNLARKLKNNCNNDSRKCVTILSKREELCLLSLSVRLTSWRQVKCSVNSEWVCSVLSRARVLCA